MFIDKKGKLFGKVSIIDILILLVIICCVAAAVMRFSGKIGDTSSQRVTVSYTLKVKPVRQISVDSITKSIGCNLYERGTNAKNCIGKIVDVKSENYRDVIELTDGTAEIAETDLRYCVTITAEAECTKTPTTLTTTDGYLISAGESEFIGSKWFACSAEITEVNIIE